MSGSKKKTRVYLSKSKAGKTEDLNRVLSLLKQYDNVEVVMWDNSDGYDKDKHHKLIASCDVLLLLPYHIGRTDVCKKDFIRMGKGQYMEFAAGINNSLNINLIDSFDDDNILVSDYFEDYEVINENWTDSYAWIECPEDLHFIDHINGWDRNYTIVDQITIEPKSQHKLMLVCYKNLIK